MRKPITLDFETEAIEKRPAYPPVPVGLAIWEPGRTPRYMAWGHPEGNNSTYEAAKGTLSAIWDSRRPLLFQNAPFDLEVAEVHFGLAYPPWHLVHDTMLLAFLNDPHAKTLSLKPTADKWLDMPPEEQDAVKAWVLDNVPGAKRKKAQWAAHISKAPGRLVGEYAIGDVVRTRKLFELFLPRVTKRAYDRERELQPLLLAADRRGVPVAKLKLTRAVSRYEKTLLGVDDGVRNQLRSPSLDVDSPKQLVEAIDKRRLVEEWELTPKGGKSAAAQSLQRTCRNKKLVGLLMYRGRLKTGLRTFGRSWIEAAYDGRLHCRWNQVVNEEGVKKYGARTGRLSSTPNLQNVPKLRPEPVEGFPALPHPREYITPSSGCVLLGRDYSQQELRILAYYIGGVVASRYVENQNLDLHTYAQEEIKRAFGFELDRRTVKTIAFGILYGMGVPRLAAALGIDKSTAYSFRQAYATIFPGLKQLQNVHRRDEYIDTWGGRHYDVEPPITHTELMRSFGEIELVEHEIVEREFSYKLLNYKIQGTAAECAKQAIINLHGALKESEFLLSVHDEFLVDCPKGAEKEEMVRLNEAMADVDFSPIQMLSDGKIGRRNWATMRKLKKE